MSLPISSWATPRLQAGGCVLDVPLWRPDMVARGGAIISGTGTMATSPVNLAVGANTITATGAGTFIVTMPEGGTVASGTATITGSPVTINAGVATTVTTGVTTGNFTVTPDNIIRSKDIYKQKITITGATWGVQGRTLDNTDDQIVIDDNNALDFVTATNFAIFAWVKFPTTINAYAPVLNKLQASGSYYGYVLAVVSSGNILFGTHLTSITGTTNSLTTGTWYLIGVTRDITDNKIRFFVNGVLVETSSSTITTMVANTNTAVIGGTNGGYNRFNGICGWVRAWNSIPTTSEIMQFYQKTKWRFS